MPVPPALSVCMIVKNEASQISEALSNFSRFADELVVVDTGSTDETRSLALRYTDRVFDFPWCDDFAAARNHSIEQATGDYVLWMDADDRVEDAAVQHIQQLKSYFDGNKAFYFILQDLGRDGPTAFFYQLRCFPRLPGIRFSGRIHEQLAVEGLTFVTTDIAVQHHGYTHSGVLLGKVRRNLAILERELADGRDDEVVHFYLALSHEKLGDLDRAIAFMEKALVRLEAPYRESTRKGLPITSTVEAHLHLARFHARAGQPDKAFVHTMEAQAAAPREAGFHLRLAGLYQIIRRHDKALECFEAARELPFAVGFQPSPTTPEPAVILVRTALSHLCIGRKDRAMECLRNATRLGMQASESWERLAFAALEAAETGVALLAFEMATETGPISDEGYNLLGGLYLARGFKTKATEAYHKALEVNPAHDRALINLALMAIENGDLREAAERLRRVSTEGLDDLDAVAVSAFLANAAGDGPALARIEANLRRDPRFEALASAESGPSYYLKASEIMRERAKPKAAAIFEDLARRAHTFTPTGF